MNLLFGNILLNLDTINFCERNSMLVIMIVIIVIGVIASIIIYKMHEKYKNLYERNQKVKIRMGNLHTDVKLLTISLDALNAHTWIYSKDENVLIHYDGITSHNSGISDLNTIDKFIEAIHPDDRAKLISMLDDCDKDPDKIFKATYRIDYKKKGKYEWWDTRGTQSLRYDNFGKATKALSGITFNVNESYDKIIQLQNAVEKAETSNKFKTEFLANMSHEIRTPLNAVVGFADAIVLSEKKEDRKEFAEIIKSNSKQLLNLVNDILDLSKIESGKMKFTITQFDFSFLFNDIYQSFRSLFATGVDFICKNPYEVCLINFDEQRMLQLINNFLSNAAKYTPHGSVTMEYMCIDSGIKVLVTDTGIGIAEEAKSSIFSRFGKFDSFAKGTGLGLSICKAIIERNNGIIGFDSTEGEGSTFWFWLPCEAQVVSSPKAGQKKTANVDVEKQLESMKGKNILLADDIRSNYQLMKAIFKDCTLDLAQNGAEAVFMARENDYDIILMDIKMPILDGLESVRQIRNFDTKIPIVAVTAHAFEKDRVEALNAGCNDVVIKPVNRDLIINVVSSWCNKK